MYFWLLYHVVCTQYGMRYHVHNMSVGPCYPDLLHPWCRINVLNHPQMSILHATRLVGHFGTLGWWSWHHPPVLWQCFTINCYITTIYVVMFKCYHFSNVSYFHLHPTSFVHYINRQCGSRFDKDLTLPIVYSVKRNVMIHVEH